MKRMSIWEKAEMKRMNEQGKAEMERMSIWEKAEMKRMSEQGKAEMKRMDIRGKGDCVHICGMLVIVWIMIHLFPFICQAKTEFEGTKPLGVMATAVGGRVAVSWEPVSGAD